MSKSSISWEIVLAGLAFIGIGLYLMNKSVSSNSSSTVWNSQSHIPSPPKAPLPGSIVIDLGNLESLKNLENLKNLKNLENLEQLEINLKNIERNIEKHVEQGVPESLDQSLKKLEAELRKIEEADFKVKLQDRKLYINKDYDVDEAKWTEVNSGVYVFRESFPVSNLKSMELNLDFGNLNVVGSDVQQGEIIIQTTGNIEDLGNLSEQLNIQKKLNDSNAQLSVTFPQGSNISDQVNLQATLTIPETVALKANTSGGHINANNMRNSQQLNTSGGHISLADIRGKTIAKTGGGHITGDQISGDMELSTGGGHIKVDHPNGSLSAKTDGGHIEIQNASGSILAKTSGGNISASVQQADGPLKFYTSAGSVSLFLPQNIAANLDVSCSSVNLDDAFNFSGTTNRGSISGSINDGGLPVVISCGYGNVNISPND